MTLATKTEAEAKARQKQLAKVRNRRSYQMFRELADFLLDSPSVEDVLRYVNGVLNDKSAYGSITAASYAKESMELVITEVNGS